MGSSCWSAAGNPAVNCRSLDNKVVLGWHSSVYNRIGELKGALDGLRHSFTILAGGVWLLATLAVFCFGFLGIQISRIDGKIDAIPTRLTEEFRTMRADMAAQTSAIANSITATRQRVR